MSKDKFWSGVRKMIIILTITSFVIIYIASEAGYFDHIKNRKVALTEEQISKFEQDIKDGKEIDVNDYYINNDDMYNNKFSNLGNNLSDRLRKVIGNALTTAFEALNDFLNS